MSLDWIYYAISWILLRWHGALGRHRGARRPVLGTNWSWILAIVFLVVTVRVILFPVFVKQIKSQRAMQALQPKVKELQEKHKGDRETLQKEMMELYRTEKANPLMGCLPMFLQIPVFLGLFHVLRRLSPANQGKTLYGWTVEQFDSAANAKLFTAPICRQVRLDRRGAGRSSARTAPPSRSSPASWSLIMIATTYLTSRQMILKTGWAEDPQQRMIQRLMLYGIPASLLISGAIFPIGVIIYWVTNNLFTLGQQQWVLRKFPPPPMVGKTGSALACRVVGRRLGSAYRLGARPRSRNPVQPAKSGGLFGRRSDAAKAKPVPRPTARSRRPSRSTARRWPPSPARSRCNPKKGRRPPAKRKG